MSHRTEYYATFTTDEADSRKHHKFITTNLRTIISCGPDCARILFITKQPLKDFKMHIEKSNTEQAPICDLIPGFGFYNNMGGGLAENLVNAFEWITDFLTRSRNWQFLR